MMEMETFSKSCRSARLGRSALWLFTFKSRRLRRLSAPPAPVLWGDMKPVVSVKELMRDMLDSASDYIFEAVKIEMTKSGTVREYAEDRRGLGPDSRRRGDDRGGCGSPEGATAVCAARRQEQQHGPRTE